MHEYECYYELGSQISQNLLKVLDQNWKSFFVAIKDYSKNPSKYLGRPKLPKYAPKDGRKEFALKNIQCRIENGKLIVSFKPLKDFTVNTNVQGKLMQVRFIPKGGCYICEIVYEIDISDLKPKQNKIVGIDLGVNNFATVSNNIGAMPIIINGKVVKSMNQYYNKKKAELQSDLKLKHDRNWSNKLRTLTNKRNNKIEYFLHCASKSIIDYCVSLDIDTIVVGRNKEWKQECNMGKKANQNFIFIPHEEFINKLRYKAQNVGIEVIDHEESYTSGTSFLDNEPPEKKYYDKSRRIKRGLFKSNNNVIINADLNGSYQIIKKVFPKAFVNGIEGVGLHPVRINV